MARRRKPPAYQLHKKTGQARVKIDGSDRYLGKHGSVESINLYNELIREWARAREPGTVKIEKSCDTTITELFVAYTEHATLYYPKTSGETTAIKQALRETRQFKTDDGKLVGTLVAREFGPLLLKSIRAAWVSRGLARSQCNKMTGRVVRAFKWGVSEELVPVGVYESLRSVDGLQEGRTDAVETEPIEPVPETVIDATLPFMPEPIKTMVQLQRLTGMRPGEVCQLRWEDIDTTHDVWIATLSKHKTKRFNKRRIVLFGPKAIALIGNPSIGYVFSPKRNAKGRNKDKANACYRERSYRQSIVRACWRRFGGREKAMLQPDQIWHPNQIRHSVATMIRRQYGVEASQILLGHSSLNTTEIYAERDLQKAIEIAKSVF